MSFPPCLPPSQPWGEDGPADPPKRGSRAGMLAAWTPSLPLLGMIRKMNGLSTLSKPAVSLEECCTFSPRAFTLATQARPLAHPTGPSSHRTIQHPLWVPTHHLVHHQSPTVSYPIMQGRTQLCECMAQWSTVSRWKSKTREKKNSGVCLVSCDGMTPGPKCSSSHTPQGHGLQLYEQRLP